MVVSGDRIVELVQIVIFITPIVGIIWKLATVVNKVNQNSKDIDNLGKKFADLLLQRQNEIINLTIKVDKLHTSVVELNTSNGHIQKNLEEMKADVKEMLKK